MDCNNYSLMLLLSALILLTPSCKKTSSTLESTFFIERSIDKEISDYFGYIQYQRINLNEEEFEIVKTSFKSTDECFRLTSRTRYKKEKDVIYMVKSLNGKPFWYPFLLLKEEQKICYPSGDRFNQDYFTCNYLLRYSEDSIAVIESSGSLHGGKDSESIIIYNSHFIPVKIDVLRIPVHEDPMEYVRLDSLTFETPKMNCNLR
jgi:hypothetical protein